MGTRTCPSCGTFVPVSNLRCHECKQLLPSMLQRAHDPESPRPMYDPDRISPVAQTAKLTQLLQAFGRK